LILILRGSQDYRRINNISVPPTFGFNEERTHRFTITDRPRRQSQLFESHNEIDNSKLKT
jgi:hypothetical protein